jgi:hypothetical protein
MNVELENAFQRRVKELCPEEHEAWTLASRELAEALNARLGNYTPLTAEEKQHFDQLMARAQEAKRAARMTFALRWHELGSKRQRDT